jgi:hypothetical protein
VGNRLTQRVGGFSELTERRRPRCPDGGSREAPGGLSPVVQSVEKIVPKLQVRIC